MTSQGYLKRPPKSVTKSPLVSISSGYTFNKLLTDIFAENLSVKLYPIIKSVIKSNHDRVGLLTKRVHKILGNSLKGKRISLLGVTFKPNTDDMRDSTSLKMIPYLCKKGARVNYYDPSGEKNEFKNLKNCYFKNNINATSKIMAQSSNW